MLAATRGTGLRDPLPELRGLVRINWRGFACTKHWDPRRQFPYQPCDGPLDNLRYLFFLIDSGLGGRP